MRNGGRRRGRPHAALVIALVAAGLALTSGGGCASDRAGRAQLEQGYEALEQRQYQQAVAWADQYLQYNPTGRGAGEALYLRGRAIEERLANQQSTPQQAANDLQAARAAYVDALNKNPSPLLEAYVRASLANVAYFQEDYATATQQWAASYPNLDRDDTKAWVLYRVGLSQQRMGQFEAADTTFAAVRERYPNTLPAQRAQERQGARSFYVQLATFSSADSADRATNALRQEGVLPVRLVDGQGRHLLRVGPVQTYAQAKGLRQRFAGPYPDALIVP